VAQAISRARRNAHVLVIGQALMPSAIVLAMTLAGIVGAVLALDKGLAAICVWLPRKPASEKTRSSNAPPERIRFGESHARTAAVLPARVGSHQ
jgi:hypothetical protein